MNSNQDKGEDFACMSAVELGHCLRDGTATSVGIVENLLGRIASIDGVLHAFVDTFERTALQYAAEADERRGRGKEKGVLDGVPFAVKDLMHMTAHSTAAGSRALSDKPATSTANAVQRLTAKGMIPIGKTHTVEFAFGSWGTNPVCGTPVNPHDLAIPRVPGGSSSGSGVAVAAGMVPVALGTDTGGSVRNPASMCGIVGLKTSHGLVGRGGLLPLATTFDTIGPLTRCVEDAAAILAELQGHDVNDAATFGCKPADPMQCLGRDIAGMRLMIPSPGDLENVDPEVLSRFTSALSEVEALGAVLEEAPMPRKPEEYMSLAGEIMATEAWCNLHSYVDAPDSVVDPVIHERISKGRQVDTATYLGMLDKRRLFQSEFDHYLDGFDALLTPTSPITAPPIDGIDENATPLGTFTRFVNLLDLAALSVPMGLSRGLPTALQIVVRRFDDPLALQIGRAFEINRGGVFEAPKSIEENKTPPNQI